jgi:hypothetical protein
MLVFRFVDELLDASLLVVAALLNKLGQEQIRGAFPRRGLLLIQHEEGGLFI